MAVLTGLVFPFIVYWARGKFKDDDKEGKDSINEEVEFSQGVTKQLEDIRELVDADRAWIAQFHNGKKYIHSVGDASMKRISVTHEAAGPGVSKEQHRFSDILVSFFAETLDAMASNGREHISCHHDSDDLNPELEVLLRQRGDESIHLFSMRNIDGDLIGLLGIDYNKRTELEEDQRAFLNVKSSLLAGYIYYGKLREENTEQQNE